VPPSQGLAAENSCHTESASESVSVSVSESEPGRRRCYGRTDRLTDRQTDGQTDGRTGRRVSSFWLLIGLLNNGVGGFNELPKNATRHEVKSFWGGVAYHWWRGRRKVLVLGLSFKRENMCELELHFYL